MKLTNNRSQKSGFTLIELMLVVAIIGILVTVGVPQYNGFKARARQTEAKTSLTSAYTALKAFYLENSIYTSCLKDIGVEAPVGDQYYAFGFKVSSDPGGKTCTAGAHFFAAKKSTTSTNATDTHLANDTKASMTAFVLSAAGFIKDGGTTPDVWTMDQDKTITNSTPGI